MYIHGDPAAPQAAAFRACVSQKSTGEDPLGLDSSRKRRRRRRGEQPGVLGPIFKQAEGWQTRTAVLADREQEEVERAKFGSPDPPSFGNTNRGSKTQIHKPRFRTTYPQTEVRKQTWQRPGEESLVQPSEDSRNLSAHLKGPRSFKKQPGMSHSLGGNRTRLESVKRILPSQSKRETDTHGVATGREIAARGE